MLEGEYEAMGLWGVPDKDDIRFVGKSGPLDWGGVDGGKFWGGCFKVVQDAGEQFGVVVGNGGFGVGGGQEGLDGLGGRLASDGAECAGSADHGSVGDFGLFQFDFRQTAGEMGDGV